MGFDISGLVEGQEAVTMGRSVDVPLPTFHREIAHDYKV